MIRAKKYVLVKKFAGAPKRSDFEVVDEVLPALKDGGFLVEAEFLSVDPYMRAYMSFPEVVTPYDMIGTQVAKVIESKCPEFPVGCRVVGQFGWRDRTVVYPDQYKPAFANMPLTRLPDFGAFPTSLGIGMLGMPGNTAYFGFLEICQPKRGETVVVTGAAGAVGSHVGQIAKIMGCKVIGFTGSDAKCDYLKNELGFDFAYNYKKVDINEALQESAAKGVDCYFDNVGGEISTTIMSHMNKHGRVSVCGFISSYNEDSLPKATIIQKAAILKELKIEGFIVTRWLDRWMEGIEANLKWLKEGKLKYKEQVWEGFENMTEAFIGMMNGENVGKAVVKA